jgi:hypothetical protein
MKGKFIWVVAIQVDESWVADGFDLDNERALDMLAGTLPYANIGTELRAQVKERPARKDIRKAQGY